MQVNGTFRLAFNLRFVWPPTCVDLRWLWSSLNWSAQLDCKSTVYAWNLRLVWTCGPTCESVWPAIPSPHARVWFCKLASTCVDLRVRLATQGKSRHKLIASHLYTREFTAFCDLSERANPFGHLSQALVLPQTCVDLRRLASSFGQGFMRMWIGGGQITNDITNSTGLLI